MIRITSLLIKYIARITIVAAFVLAIKNETAIAQVPVVHLSASLLVLQDPTAPPPISSVVNQLSAGVSTGSSPIWNLVSAPSHGTTGMSFPDAPLGITAGAPLVPDGSVAYTPNPGYCGLDAFTVSITDASDPSENILIEVDVEVITINMAQNAYEGAITFTSKGTCSTPDGGTATFTVVPDDKIEYSGPNYAANNADCCPTDTSGIKVSNSAASASIHYHLVLPGNKQVTTTVASTSLNGIRALSIASSGDLYGADAGNNRIFLMSHTGTTGLLAGNGYGMFYGDSGLAVYASLNNPYGIATDKAGNTLICDQYNNRVRMVHKKTGIINTIAGNGAAGYSGDGASALAAAIGYPAGIAVDAMGNTYFSDTLHHVIRKIDSAGMIHTIAGTGAAGYSGDGGAATAAQLSNPQGMSTDATGTLLFIAEPGNNVIRKIDLSTGMISTVAGTGVAGNSGDSSAATTAQLNYPTGVTADDFGDLYIADYNNNRVRKINIFGVIDKFCGTGAPGSSGNGGTADSCQLSSPSGLAVDHTGRLYIADMANNRIQGIGTPVVFTAGFFTALPVCENASATSINDLLAVSDLHTGLTETWTVFGAPQHGSLGGFSTSVTAAATGGIVLPAGVSYTPTTGYSGTDTFYIQVSNGADMPIIAIAVSVNAAPSAITGSVPLCIGGTTTLTEAVTGGTWSSSNTAMATVGSGDGIVTGVAVGTATITYTGACGMATTTVTVMPSSAAPTVASVSPLMGYPASSVTITGTNFSANPLSDIVWFGATQATVTSASNTSLTVTVPCGATYMQVSVDNITCRLTGFSESRYLPTFNNAGYLPFANFSASVDYPTGLVTSSHGSNPVGVAIGDIDGDGKPDIVVCNQDANSISVFHNTSATGTITAGSFAAKVDFATTNNPYRMAIGDLDGDGKPELAVACYNGDVSIFRNTSVAGTIDSNSFSPRIDPSLGDSFTSPSNVFISDVDGDGKPDLVVLGLSYWGVLRNTGTGPLTSSSLVSRTTIGVVGISGEAFTVGDLDGDGKPDVVVNYHGTGEDSVYVYRNTTSGSSISFAWPVPFYTGAPSAMTIGDIDGDGKPELVVANWPFSGGYVSVLRNLSTPGSFTTASLASHVDFATGPRLSDVAIADLDGDGKADIVAISPNEISVLRNTSTSGTISSGSFAGFFGMSSTVAGLELGRFGVAIGDLNCDGKPDIVVSDYDNNLVSVLNNNPLLPVTGTTVVCALATTTLSDGTTGGTWSSSNTTIATVGSTGIVTGVAGGTATISYTVPGGFATATVTVNPIPATITGTTAICGIGNTTSLSDVTTGATWSSSNTGIATIGSTGVVTGVGTGAVTISYALPTGCYVTMPVTIYPMPSAISGNLAICGVGVPTTLGNTAPGGLWSTVPFPIGTVGATTGVVTGVATGFIPVTYTVHAGCMATTVVTVNVAPSPITGPGTVCSGSTISLNNFTGFQGFGLYKWTGGDPSVATITTGGTVTGIATGATTVTFSVNAGCFTTAVVSVNPSPAAITGSGNVCVGGAMAPGEVTGGGTWSSNCSACVSVDPTSGVVTGLLAPTFPTLTYTLPTGCLTTAQVTVNSSPVAITGVATVCEGAATTLHDGTTGGRWTSGITGSASVGSGTGIVTGVTAGIVPVTYALTTTGCMTTAQITVNPLPSPIMGATAVCTGATTPLSDGTTGGTWSSSNLSATIDPGTGLLSGMSAVKDTIAYTTPAGCMTTIFMTVNPLPGAGTITGSTNVNTGATASLLDATTGGTWSSSNTAIATVGSTGLVTGVAVGTATISYEVTNVCGTAYATATENVASYCSPAFLDAVSSCTFGYNIYPFLTTGESGTAINDYTHCNGTTDYEDNSSTMSVTYDQGVTYTAGIACSVYGGGGSGQVWIDFNDNGTFESSESVGGIHFYYSTSPSSFSITIPPNAATGEHRMRVVSAYPGFGSTFYPGIDPCATGATYGDARDYSVVINYQPTFVGGATQNLAVCQNTPAASIDSLAAFFDSNTGNADTMTLISGPLHGTVSGFPATFTSTGSAISPTGLAYTPAAGYSGTDAFTIQLSDGTITTSATINVTIDTAIPASPITGSTTACVSSYILLSDSTPGGSWNVSNGSFSNSGYGYFYGLFPGVDTATYTISNSCGTTIDTVVITVPPYPSIGDISGPASVYTDSTITLIDTPAGGTWFSSDYTIATVSGLGAVTGVSPGMALIFYDYTNACGMSSGTSVWVTVSTAPVGGISPLINTFAGNGAAAYAGDGGTVYASQLSNPTGITVDAGGNIYIADKNNNVVRKVSTSGTITTIAGVNALGAGYNGDGIPANTAQLNNPVGVAVDASGNLYIADQGNQVIRIVDASGNINTFAGTPGSSGYWGDTGPAVYASLSNPSSVAVDASGNVYIADQGNNVIRNVAPWGYIYTFAGDGSGVAGYSGDGAAANAALLNNPSAVATDISGNVYIADEGNNIVRIVDGSGNINAFAGTPGVPGNTGDGGPALAASLQTPSGIVVDISGNVFIADSLSNVVRKVDVSGNISTYAGDATPGYSGDGNPANDISVQINNPSGMAFDTAGNLYIADQTNNVVRLVGTLPAYYTAPVFTNGSSQAFHVCMNATATSIDPILATIDSNAGLTDTFTIISAPANGSLGGFPTTVAATGSATTTTGLTYMPAAGYSGPDVFTIQASNGKRTATTTVYISVDTVLTSIPPITGTIPAYPGILFTLTDAASGGVWSSSDYTIAAVYDYGYGFVYAEGLMPGTASITYTVTNGCGSLSTPQTVTFAYPTGVTSPDIYTFAGNGINGYSGDGGSASSAELLYPSSVAVDNAGNVYIADMLNFVVRKVGVSGNISTIAGNGSYGYSGDGAPATNAALSYVYGIAVDGSGNVFLADMYNDVVRKVDASGNISTYAGNNTAGYTGDGTAATLAQLNNPRGVCLDGAGNLYIADYSNFVVRKVDAAGNISTFAGNGSYGYYLSDIGDGGPATAATLSQPTGIAFDGSGNAYISNWTGNVRKVAISGAISTFAGVNGSSGFSGDGGAATAAQFNGMAGIAVDNSGNVYIADMLNNVVRKVDGSGMISSYAGYGGFGYSGDGGPANDARLSDPGGVAVTGSGILYIADESNSVVRIVGAATHAHSAAFIGGAMQPFVVCENTLAAPVNTLLGISDSAIGLVDSFTISSGPSHGMLGGFATTDTSNGGTITPSGLTYTPASGYIGNDTFTIRVSDGSATATTTIFVTVNPLPFAGTISGATAFCAGSATTFADTAAGGVWSSNNTEIATIGEAGISGIAAGVANISYTVTNGCGVASAVTTVTVIASPASGTITGAGTVCKGVYSAITLMDTATGGTWSCTNSRATISAAGMLTGVTNGLDTVKYTVTNMCGTSTASKVIAIGTLTVSAISGTPTSVCNGTAIALTDATPGGTWSSSNTSIATVSAGAVATLSPGIDTIIYSVSGSCGFSNVIKAITVKAIPSAGPIAGLSSVCAGSTITLTDTSTIGSHTWSSSNTATATVSTSGVVKGISPSAVTITFTHTVNGCVNSETALVTVDSIPFVASIAGTSSVCVHATDTLSDVTPGGVWSTNSAARATIGSVTGVVTGVSSSSPAPMITYSLTDMNGCTNKATATVTVNAVPVVAAIGGPATICAGSPMTFTDLTAGGVWTYTDPGYPIAIFDSAATVTDMFAGPDSMIYTVTNATTGCATSVHKTVTVNPLPAVPVITGASAICLGSLPLTVLHGSTGTPDSWTTSNAAIATISTGGTITTVSAGVDTFTYTYTSGGCRNSATTVVTVNALPVVAPITGITSVCIHSSDTLSDATPGGEWSTSSAAKATVGSATGVVTGLSSTSPVPTITYSLTDMNGCTNKATVNVTINAVPVVAAIAGPATICAGSPMTFTDLTPGGIWTYTDPGYAIAVFDSAAVLTDSVSGPDSIIYTVTNGITGCTTSVHKTVTVNPLPTVPVITGAGSICLGSLPLTVLHGSTGSPDSWTSSNAAVAIISTGGTITTVSAGVDTLTYTYTSGGCRNSATTIVTVNALPVVAPITGMVAVCIGSTDTLSDITPGGVWITSSATRAAVGSVTGFVTGVNAATPVPIITYKVTDGNGCINTATTPVTVNALPTVATISGATSVCAGATILLADATTGGTWSSSDVTIATVDGSGHVLGVTASALTITYTVTNVSGCSSSKYKTVSVNPLPVAGIISGPLTLPMGSTITLVDTTSGGTWTSHSTAIATITAAGIVHGVAVGTSVISYSVASHSCGTAIATVTISVTSHSGSRQIDTSSTSTDNEHTQVPVIVKTLAPISVYPNPTNGSFTIDLSEIKSNVTVNITDEEGRLIETREVSGNDERKAQYNLSNVARGTYLIQIVGSGTIYQGKIVIW